MARPYSDDFLQAMRFHVQVTGAGVSDLRISTDTITGFMSCTTPEVSVETVEYREGTYNYARRYPGNASAGSEVTMQRGVTKSDSAFWEWCRVVVDGSGPYRSTAVEIKHYDRNVLIGKRHHTLGIPAAPPVFNGGAFGRLDTTPSIVTPLQVAAAQQDQRIGAPVNGYRDVPPAKTYKLTNAFPTRCKIAGDLDASSSDISIAEMDVAYEYFLVD